MRLAPLVPKPNSATPGKRKSPSPRFGRSRVAPRLPTYWEPASNDPVNQVKTWGILPKLEVSDVNDPLEREADAIADRVMRMPATSHEVSADLPSESDTGLDEIEDEELSESPTVGAFAGAAALPGAPGLVAQRKCVTCETEDEDEIHRSVADALVMRKCETCEDEDELRRTCASCDAKEDESIMREPTDSLLTVHESTPIRPRTPLAFARLSSIDDSVPLFNEWSRAPESDIYRRTPPPKPVLDWMTERNIREPAARWRGGATGPAFTFEHGMFSRSDEEIQRRTCTGPDPSDESLSRQCAKCDEEQLQREAASGAKGGVASDEFTHELHARMSRSDAPLSACARDFLEPRLGVHLGNVRIHTDNAAASLAERIGARAFSVHEHVFFAQGQYRPTTSEGLRLITHEVAHTLQYRGLATDAAAGAPAIRRAPPNVIENPGCTQLLADVEAKTSMDVCTILDDPAINPFVALDCLHQRYGSDLNSVYERPPVVTELEQALQFDGHGFEHYYLDNCGSPTEYPYDSEGCQATGIDKYDAARMAIRNNHLTCGDLQSLGPQDLDWIRREICRTEDDSLISGVVITEIVPELLYKSGLTKDEVMKADPEMLHDQACKRSWESLATEITAKPVEEDIYIIRWEEDEDADGEAAQLPTPTNVEHAVEIRKREDFAGQQVNQDLLDAIGMTKDLKALEHVFVEIEKHEVYAYRRMLVADALRPLLSFEKALFDCGERRRDYTDTLALLRSQHKKLEKDEEQKGVVAEEIEMTLDDIAFIDDEIIQILVDMIPHEEEAAVACGWLSEDYGELLYQRYSQVKDGDIVKLLWSRKHDKPHSESPSGRIAKHEGSAERNRRQAADLIADLPALREKAQASSVEKLGHARHSVREELLEVIDELVGYHQEMWRLGNEEPDYRKFDDLSKKIADATARRDALLLRQQGIKRLLAQGDELDLDSDVSQYFVKRGDDELLMHRDVSSTTRGALRVKGHLKLTEEDIANGFALAKVNIDEATFRKMMGFFIASEGNFDDYYTDFTPKTDTSKANAGIGFTNQKLIKLINRFASRPENAQAFHDLFGSLGIETTGNEYELKVTRPLHGGAESSYMAQIDPDYERKIAEGGVVLDGYEFNRLAAVSLELNAAIAVALRDEAFRAEFAAWIAEQTAQAHEYPIGRLGTWGEIGKVFRPSYSSDSSLRTAWLMPYVHYNIAGAYGKQAFGEFPDCFPRIPADGPNPEIAAVLWWRSTWRLRFKSDGPKKRWNLMTSAYGGHPWYQDLLAGEHKEVELCESSTSIASKAEATASDEGEDTENQ